MDGKNTERHTVTPHSDTHSVTHTHTQTHRGVEEEAGAGDQI